MNDIDRDKKFNELVEVLKPIRSLIHNDSLTNIRRYTLVLTSDRICNICEVSHNMLSTRTIKELFNLYDEVRAKRNKEYGM